MSLSPAIFFHSMPGYFERISSGILLAASPILSDYGFFRTYTGPKQAQPPKIITFNNVLVFLENFRGSQMEFYFFPNLASHN
jgi:hypothetical protein